MIRNILLVVLHITFLTTSCVTYKKEQHSSPPAWFGQLEHKDYEIIGYGEGETLKISQTNAKANVAAQIRTNIIAKHEFKAALIDNKFKEEVSTQVNELTSMELTEVIKLREEQDNGRWFAAYKYEKIPFEIKVKKRLSSYPCNDQKQNKYLSKTPLGNALNRKVGCIRDYQLLRKNGLWYLSYHDTLIPLMPEDFERLYAGYIDKKLKLSTNNTKLKEKDSFNFNIEADISGYLTLLNIYENGEVAVIFSNKKIKKNKKYIYPENNTDVELIAGLLTPKEQTFELYVALLSLETLDLGRFNQAGAELESTKNNFKFQEFMELANNNIFSSVFIRIFPVK